jgi:hypothetical protein
MSVSFITAPDSPKPIVVQILTKLPNGTWNVIDKRNFLTVPTNGHFIEIESYETGTSITYLYEVLAIVHPVTSTGELLSLKIYTKQVGTSLEFTKKLG